MPRFSTQRWTARLFSLRLHQNSLHTSHVSGNGGWRHGPALESSGLSSPRGSLRAAEGRNGGVGERRLHILVFARHISLHSYGQHLRELDDVAASDTRLYAGLGGG